MDERHSHQSCTKAKSSMPGFLDTCLGQTMSFEVQRGEFIQILHDGHGHWLMVSSVINEDNAQVYDSMYPTIGTYTKKRIACILSRKR